MERKEQVELPFDMLREAVVNALIHRNYDLGGEKCQLIVTPNYIRVRSPGRPIEPITLDMMNDFSVPMRSRNPILHFVMARVGMAEEQGFGLVSLREEAVALGIPLPKYSYEDPYLDLTIYRTQDAQVDDMLSELSDEIRNELSDEELAGWLWMTTQGPVSKAEYVKQMKVPQRTAERHLKHLSDFGIVTRSGSGPSTRYEA
jgi:ATP-dependent DNA helicase RecG